MVQTTNYDIGYGDNGDPMMKNGDDDAYDVDDGYCMTIVVAITEGGDKSWC